MFKLEFDTTNKPLAAAIGQALVDYAEGVAVLRVEPVGMSAPVDGITRTVESSVTRPDGAVHKTTSTTTAQTPERITRDDPAGCPGDFKDPLYDKRNAPGDDEKVDEKGVAFNATFCSTAKEPFYKKGPTRGQWKKRQGLGQHQYDSWYAAKLADVTSAPLVEDDEPVDTAGAFGGIATAPADVVAFTDAGQLMAWVSEQQAAGRLTLLDVDGAYKMTGVSVPDMFNPATAEASIAAVHGFLAPIAAGA